MLFVVFVIALVSRNIHHPPGVIPARPASPETLTRPVLSAQLAEIATPSPTYEATAHHAMATMATTRTPTPTEIPPEPSVVASGPARVLEKGTSGRREIALTFDGGADRGDAEAILDILDTYGVTASFGVTGEWAEENPDLVQRMVDDGHMLFSHTTTHRSWTGYSTSSDLNDPSTWVPLTSAERRDELRQAEDIIRKLTGYELRPYFRPP